jgi:glycosyltransferase involved in cell wall biosynthesis
MLYEVERLPDTCAVYYLADYAPERSDEYIAFWHSPPAHWVAKLLKPPLSKLAIHMLTREGKPIPHQYENAVCVSEYVRCRLVEQGLIPPTSVVIHNGVDLDRFRSDGRHRDFTKPLAFLYAGRLDPHKGAHRVLEALSLLSEDELSHIRELAIVGDGDHAYRAKLLRMTENLGLSSLVCFRPPIDRSQMPTLLDQYDVLILPSALEALSRMMQEAMAMGLLVIGTATGGSCELLQHGRTGLVFEADSAESLASQLCRLLDEPDSMAQQAVAGNKRVMESFNIEHTVERIERHLLNLIEARPG